MNIQLLESHSLSTCCSKFPSFEQITGSYPAQLLVDKIAFCKRKVTRRSRMVLLLRCLSSEKEVPDGYILSYV
jgi:hypothetical protein